MTIQDNILTADEGKWLTNGQTYSQQVWLGINDSPSNWHEVNESEAEELTDSEALQIITEGE